MVGAWIAVGVGIALAIAVGLALAVRTNSRRRRVVGENLTIDIDQLAAKGPDREAPVLEVYGVPARLAVLVLAPLGRGTCLPDNDQLRATVDLLLPDLSLILDHDRPIFRRWGTQLSAHGFPQAFSNNLRLPGNKGQGTPWCSVTGRFQTPSGVLLAGLILCADRSNSLSHFQIEHEGQWHDALRIRR